MIVIDRNTTKKRLLDELISQSGLSGDLILLIDCLPVFLSSAISFRNFVYTVGDYPRKIFYFTNNKEVLGFLRKIGAQVKSPDNLNNSIILQSGNYIQSLTPISQILDKYTTNEERVQKVKNEYPEVLFELQDLKTNAISSFKEKVKDYISTSKSEDIHFNSLLEGISQIQKNIKNKQQDNSNYPEKNRYSFVKVIMIFIVLATFLLLLFSIIPYKTIHKVYIDSGESTQTGNIYILNSYLNKEKTSYFNLSLGELYTNKGEIESLLNFDNNIYELKDIKLNKHIEESNEYIVTYTLKYKNVPNGEDVLDSLNSGCQELDKCLDHVVKYEKTSSGFNLPWSKKTHQINIY